jgi:hypothetical protein
MGPDSSSFALLTTNGFRPVAKLRPRCSTEIPGSPWSVGLETIDRDYVRFAEIAPHLAELGAKHARVQAGWARCEPLVGGPYSWAWLDEIVHGCLAAGVRPWLQLSYGHPGYPGGGGVGLCQELPASPEALRAWDAWVDATVTRYGDKVRTWEIWNEPDNHGVIPPETYADFFIRTGRRIRTSRPEAELVGLALAWHDEKNYAGRFLDALAAAGELSLLDQLCFHFYPHNPDEQFDVAADLLRLIRACGSRATLRQGETGAPSECSRFMALGEHLWNERKQAAWNLRRLLGHHARGIPMNLFQLADMYYAPRDGALFSGYNPKGQLRIRPDLTVAYRKPSFFAAQHVFSLLDDAYPLRALERLPGRFPSRTEAYAWTRVGEKHPDLIAWWRADAPPGLVAPDADEPYRRIGLSPHAFREPVLVDFLSGVAFAPPEGFDRASPSAWRQLPCSDTPFAIAERTALPLRDL